MPINRRHDVAEQESTSERLLTCRFESDELNGSEARATQNVHEPTSHVLMSAGHKKNGGIH